MRRREDGHCPNIFDPQVASDPMKVTCGTGVGGVNVQYLPTETMTKTGSRILCPEPGETLHIGSQLSRRV